jgi:hypothetical protein
MRSLKRLQPKKPPVIRGPVGRPEQYTKEYLDELADKFVEWADKEDSIWFKSFLLDHGILPTNVKPFIDKSEKFSEAVKYAKHKQEEHLLKGAITNKYNAKMVALTLTNFHKWAEKQEMIHSGSVESSVKVLLQGAESNHGLVRLDEGDVVEVECLDGGESSPD